MNTIASLCIRRATAADVEAMTDIYAHHVLHGTGSFEETTPTKQEMEQRWQEREQQAYPTLIALLDEQIAGFAYAGNYKQRSAYRFTGLARCAGLKV